MSNNQPVLMQPSVVISIVDAFFDSQRDEIKHQLRSEMDQAVDRMVDKLATKVKTLLIPANSAETTQIQLDTKSLNELYYSPMFTTGNKAKKFFKLSSAVVNNSNNNNTSDGDISTTGFVSNNVDDGFEFARPFLPRMRDDFQSDLILPPPQRPRRASFESVDQMSLNSDDLELASLRTDFVGNPTGFAKGTTTGRQSGKFLCSRDECGKRFPTEGKLRSHQREVHLRLKPYQCAWEGCDYASPRKRATLKHIRSMHIAKMVTTNAPITATAETDSSLNVDETQSLASELQPTPSLDPMHYLHIDEEVLQRFNES